MLSWHWAEIGSAFSRDYRQNRVRTRYLIGHTEQLDYKHQNCSPLNPEILRKKLIILIDFFLFYEKNYNKNLKKRIAFIFTLASLTV